MDRAPKTTVSDVLKYLRTTVDMLINPFDVIRNNRAIGLRLKVEGSLRVRMRALEVEQYGAQLGHAEELARIGLEQLRSPYAFAEGSLGRRYREWMTEHEFDTDQVYQSVEPILDMGFPIVAFYNAYGHDLGHILADIDTSVDDEFFYQGVLNGTPLPTLNTMFFRRWLTFSVLRAVQFGGLRGLWTSGRAFRRGWELANNFGVGGIGSSLTVPYLDRPVEQVRRAFNVPAGGLTRLRALPAARPAIEAIEERCAASTTAMRMQVCAIGGR